MQEWDFTRKKRKSREVLNKLCWSWTLKWSHYSGGENIAVILLQLCFSECFFKHSSALLSAAGHFYLAYLMQHTLNLPSLDIPVPLYIKCQLPLKKVFLIILVCGGLKVVDLNNSLSIVNMTMVGKTELGSQYCCFCALAVRSSFSPCKEAKDTSCSWALLCFSWWNFSLK